MEVIAAQSLEQVPIECIRASRTNPRRHFDDASLAELAASIAEVGLQVPLLVRPLLNDDHVDMISNYEIVGGERRYRAAMSLGYETVPCLVRDMTDAEALEIQIVENLQRADVLPMEEAEAFDDLVKTLGSIPAAAQRLGKEQSYVAKLLRLMALTLPARDAMRAGLISIEHALLLARLADAEQNAALKWCLDHNAGAKTAVEKVVEERTAIRAKEGAETGNGEKRYFHYTWEPQSVVRLKSWIEAESGIPLMRAPWPLDQDDLLFDVVCCNDCPQNTKANSPLFGDLAMGDATCTNGACFAAKKEAFVRIAMRRAPSDSLPVRVSWKSSTVKPSIIHVETSGTLLLPESANPAKLLKYGQWIDAKAGSCTNVRTGITVDWSDAGDRGYMGGEKKLRTPGEAVNICIAVGCKVHPKGWEKKPKGGGSQQERRDPEAEKRAEEQQAHLEKVEREIRSTLLHAILGKLDAAKAIRMVAENQRGAAEQRKRLLDVMPELDGLTLEAFTLFCCEFSGYIRPNGWYLMQPNGVATDRKQIFALAKHAGVDPVKLTAKYFHDQDSIAPWSDRLYPKGVPWPKDAKAKAAPAKKAAAKKTAAKKTAGKKAASKPALRKSEAVMKKASEVRKAQKKKAVA